MHLKLELWRKGLKEGRPIYSRPKGASMVPTLRQGDMVTVVPLHRCLIGDIILYSRGDFLVMHRVVAKFADRIITKGDAVGHLDPWVSDQDILGRAVAYERNGRIRSLDSLGARLAGLAFSLTVAWVPPLLILLAAVKRLGQDKLGLAPR